MYPIFFSVAYEWNKLNLNENRTYLCEYSPLLWSWLQSRRNFMSVFPDGFLFIFLLVFDMLMSLCKWLSFCFVVVFRLSASRLLFVYQCCRLWAMTLSPMCERVKCVLSLACQLGVYLEPLSGVWTEKKTWKKSRQIYNIPMKQFQNIFVLIQSVFNSIEVSLRLMRSCLFRLLQSLRS